MIYTSIISTKGQTTIPEEVRIAMNIKPGDKIKFVLSASSTTPQALIERIPTLDEIGGSLHIPGMKYTPLAVIRKKLAKEQQNETWI